MVRNDERSNHLIFHAMRNAARVTRNSVSDEVVALERAGATFADIRHLVAGLPSREGLARGDLKYGVWWASMAQSLIDDIPTVAELLDRIMGEADSIIVQRLKALLNG